MAHAVVTGGVQTSEKLRKILCTPLLPRSENFPTVANLKALGYIKEEDGNTELDLEKSLDLQYTLLSGHSAILQRFNNEHFEKKENPHGKLTLAKKLARVEELRETVKKQQLALAENFSIICR